MALLTGVKGIVPGEELTNDHRLCMWSKWCSSCCEVLQPHSETSNGSKCNPSQSTRLVVERGMHCTSGVEYVLGVAGNMYYLLNNEWEEVRRWFFFFLAS